MKNALKKFFQENGIDFKWDELPEQLTIKQLYEGVRRDIEKFKQNIKEAAEENDEKSEKKEKTPKEEPKCKGLCVGLSLLFFLIFTIYMKVGQEDWEELTRNGAKYVNYYEVLECTPEDSASIIKKNFRRLAKIHHPDRSGSENSEKFVEISKAYEVLSNKNARKNYDESKGYMGKGGYIKSKTVLLNVDNYSRIVLESTSFWVIQIFRHDSNHCARFSDDWEALAKEYPFLKFGRIDFRSSQKLQSVLPFRILELPFIFVHQDGMEPDFVEYKYGSEASAVRKLLFNRFGKDYSKLDLKGLKELLGGDGPKVQREVRSRIVHPRVVHLSTKKRRFDPYFHYESGRRQNSESMFATRFEIFEDAKNFIRKDLNISLKDSDSILIISDKRKILPFKNFEEAAPVFKALNLEFIHRDNFEDLIFKNLIVTTEKDLFVTYRKNSFEKDTAVALVHELFQPELWKFFEEIIRAKIFHYNIESREIKVPKRKCKKLEQFYQEIEQEKSFFLSSFTKDISDLRDILRKYNETPIKILIRIMKKNLTSWKTLTILFIAGLQILIPIKIPYKTVVLIVVYLVLYIGDVYYQFSSYEDRLFI